MGRWTDTKWLRKGEQPGGFFWTLSGQGQSHWCRDADSATVLDEILEGTFRERSEARNKDLCLK